jgi:hypothetical protein
MIAASSQDSLLSKIVLKTVKGDVILIPARTRLHLVTFLVLFDRSSGLVPLDVILIPA